MTRTMWGEIKETWMFEDHTANCTLLLSHSLTLSYFSCLTHSLTTIPSTTSSSEVITVSVINPRARRGMGERGGIFSCRVGSVRNIVRSKICANQGNRTTPSDPYQENPNFPHFSPEFLRNKFENFFQNSYRTIVLTNSQKEVPKFFIKYQDEICKMYSPPPFLYLLWLTILTCRGCRGGAGEGHICA